MNSAVAWACHAILSLMFGSYNTWDETENKTTKTRDYNSPKVQNA